MKFNKSLRITSVNPRLQAVFAYVLLFCLIVFIGQWMIAPALQLRANYFSEIQHLIRLNNGALQQIKHLEHTSRDNDTTEELHPQRELLPSTNEALAVVALQDKARTLLENQESELINMNFKRETGSSPYQGVTVNLRLRSSVKALADFLYQLEAEETLLLVNNLNIQSRHREGRLLNTNTDELEVRLDITAYYEAVHDTQ